MKTKIWRTLTIKSNLTNRLEDLISAGSYSRQVSRSKHQEQALLQPPTVLSCNQHTAGTHCNPLWIYYVLKACTLISQNKYLDFNKGGLCKCNCFAIETSCLLKILGLEAWDARLPVTNWLTPLKYKAGKHATGTVSGYLMVFEGTSLESSVALGLFVFGLTTITPSHSAKESTSRPDMTPWPMSVSNVPSASPIRLVLQKQGSKPPAHYCTFCAFLHASSLRHNQHHNFLWRIHPFCSLQVGVHTAKDIRKTNPTRKSNYPQTCFEWNFQRFKAKAARDLQKFTALAATFLCTPLPTARHARSVHRLGDHGGKTVKRRLTLLANISIYFKVVHVIVFFQCVWKAADFRSV